MSVTIGARSWLSEKQPMRRAAPSSLTGPGFSFGSTRFWRWRSGTPGSASNRRGTSPWAGRCALRLGEKFAEVGVIDEPSDVFFLTRAELDKRGDLSDVVADRRRRWEHQRRLVAPLALGTPPKAIRNLLHGAAETARTRPIPPDTLLTGEPASPGRATGPVRIVRDPGDLSRFEEGEVLVAQLTAPAWTPLFARAAAVVTDGGTLAAHASLVAREYGIPAVVATGCATLRLRDGQVVTLDGGAGTVEVGRWPPRLARRS